MMNCQGERQHSVKRCVAFDLSVAVGNLLQVRQLFTGPGVDAGLGRCVCDLSEIVSLKLTDRPRDD